MRKIAFQPITWLLLLLLILATQFPTLFAFYQSGEGYQFGGFLLNPIDGNSYLAKMAQGWEGNWMFELPFTYKESKPAALFLFYLFLGHLSRWLNLELIMVYHLARLISTLFMFYMLTRFYYQLFGDPSLSHKLLVWVLFGAGIGWVGIFFHQFSVDFWLAEAYPFLSAFVNPHFPLGLGIMLWMFDKQILQARQGSWLLICDFLFGVILGNISPFSVVVVCLVYGGIALIYFIKQSRDPLIRLFRRAIPFFLGSIPFLIYQVWVTKSDILLSEWSAQNITPTPPIYLFILGFIPVLLWSIWGIIEARKISDDQVWIACLWIILELILIYLPTSLQRRFSVGLYVPLVACAGLAFQSLSEKFPKRKNSIRWLFNLSIGLSLITNGVILTSMLNPIIHHNPDLYLRKDEVMAYQWMRDNIGKETVVISGEESGLLIPAYGGQRVIYGHPYESPNAKILQNTLLSFYSGKMALSEQSRIIQEYQVDYILWGYREKAVSSSPPSILSTNQVKLIFDNPALSIFKVQAIQ